MNAPLRPSLQRLAGMAGIAVLALGPGVGSAPGQSKTTFQDHVLPLVENSCAKCHNPDKKKGDLDLTTHAGVLKGGASGPVVVAGNPDASKLFKVITHADEPTMPPNKPRMPDKESEVYKRWILDGLLETSGSKAIAAAKPSVDLTLQVSNEGKPSGAPAMPSGIPTTARVHTTRPGAVLSVASSPWAPVIAICGQKQILLYHAESLDRLGVLAFTNGQPSQVRFSRSGQLLMASGGQGGKSGRVALWNVTDGKPVAVIGQEFDTALTADIRPDQSQVALGGPGRVLKIHSTATGEAEQKIKKHTDWITAVAYSPNGKLLASADRNGSIHIWDPENGQEMFALAGHPSAVRAISWRGDSRVLASCSEDGTVKTWEMEGGKQVKSWTAHEGGALDVAFAHDGGLVSCGRNARVRTWDGDGNKRKTFEAKDELPLSVTFTHDGKRVICGTFSGRVLVWNVADGKLAGELDSNPGVQTASAAAPSSR